MSIRLAVFTAPLRRLGPASLCRSYLTSRPAVVRRLSPQPVNNNGPNTAVSPEMQEYQRGEFMRLIEDLQAALMFPAGNSEQIQQKLTESFSAGTIHAIPFRLLAAANSAMLNAFELEYPPVIDAQGVKSFMFSPTEPVQSTSCATPGNNRPSYSFEQASIALASIGFWDLLRAVMQTLLAQEKPLLALKLSSSTKIYKVRDQSSKSLHPDFCANERTLRFPSHIELLAIAQEIQAAKEMLNRPKTIGDMWPDENEKQINEHFGMIDQAGIISGQSCPETIPTIDPKPEHLKSLPKFQIYLEEITLNQKHYKLECLTKDMMLLTESDELYCHRSAWLLLLQSLSQLNLSKPIMNAWAYVKNVVFPKSAPPAQYWFPILSSHTKQHYLLDCWDDLVKLDVIPNGSCYYAFISVAFKLEMPDIAMTAFSEYSERFDSIAHISQKMIIEVVQGLLRTRGRETAEIFMRDLSPEQKNLDFYNSLMAYYAGRGEVQELSQLLLQMKNNEVQPSVHTFALMLAGMILKAESPQEVSASLKRLLSVTQTFPKINIDAKFYAITLRVLVQQNVTEAQLKVAVQLLKEMSASNIKADEDTLIKIFSNGIKTIENDSDRRVFARTMLAQFHELGHVLHPKLLREIYRHKPSIELLDWLCLASVDKLPNVEAWFEYLKIAIRFDRGNKLAKEAVAEIRRRRILEDLQTSSQHTFDVAKWLQDLMESVGNGQ